MALMDGNDPWVVPDWLNDQPQQQPATQGGTDPTTKSPDPTQPAAQPAPDPAAAAEAARAQAAATTQAQVAPPAGRGRGDIDAALKNAKSSDDANYWYGKIEGDPNGYGSAWDYWVDRINRGDGAQLGLPKFVDGPGKTPGQPINISGMIPPAPTMTSAVTPNNPYAASGMPTVNIGADPMSLKVDDALMGILDNKGRDVSPVGQQAQDALSAYFKRGGDSNARLESIREKMGLLQRAQMNDARGELASRGLLSEGSTSQGPELSTLGRVNANIAQNYSTEARNALIADDQEMMSAIQTATGLDNAAAQRVLTAATTITQRQQMLGDLAAKSLDQNIAWQEFLANYGLDRDKVAAQIQQGQIANLIPLINAFTNQAGTASGGFV